MSGLDPRLESHHLPQSKPSAPNNLTQFECVMARACGRWTEVLVAGLGSSAHCSGAQCQLGWGETETERMKTHWANKRTADPVCTVDRDKFKTLLQLKSDSFSERLFRVLKGESSGDSVSLHHLREQQKLLTTLTYRLRLLFRLCDVSNSGSIHRDHLQALVTSSLEESSLELSQDDVEHLSDALFDDVSGDVSVSGDVIDWEQWSRHFHERPQFVSDFTLQVKVVFAVFFVLLNIAVGCVNVWQYWDSNWCIKVARAAGMCLDLDLVLALLLMLRRTLTWVHRPPLVSLLPLDHHVLFHKMAGYSVLVMAVVHSVFHVLNAGEGGCLDFEWGLCLVGIVFTLRADVGWVAGFTPLSGVLLMLLVLLLFLCSLQCVRRRGCFEIFYWTHKLFVPILVLTILHATHFWKWIVVPLFIYCLEQGFKLRGMCASCSGRLHCENVTLFPSGVAEVKISRPRGFVFEAGDYIYLNIPAIARYEWHPFTISSARQVKDTLAVHIRAVGHWTRRMYNYFEDLAANLDTTSPQTTGPRSVSTAHCPESGRQSYAHSTILTPDLKQLDSKRGFSNLAFCGVDLQGRSPLPTVHIEADVEQGQQTYITPMDAVSAVSPMEKASDDTLSVLEQGLSHRFAVNSLYDLEGGGGQFDDLPAREPSYLQDEQTDCEQGRYNVERICQVYLNGPYGTPSRHILNVEHAILIGSGIGVTPFASVMQSMVYPMRQKEDKSSLCPSFLSDHRHEISLKKVDFIWINRDRRSFDWLLPILTRLEHDQSREGGSGHVIDMQIYLTSAPSREDVKGAVLQMAVDAAFRHQGRDFFTGLQTPTRLGRPNFDQILADIPRKAGSKVKVFFCGSPSLRNTVKDACQRHGIQFCREHF
ncbi:NADPH oxidase 5-like [Babylonia areolata]|uniref:NADPH oxidase 5-like n=1 Tax=Babylonia areolata TaxID=304850 RepID=UPI003FD2826C